MPVHTAREYEEKSTQQTGLPIGEQEEVEVMGAVAEAPPAVSFVLLHPEREVGQLKNFEDEVILDGIKYKRQCEAGIIKTKEGRLKDYLLKQGYQLIRTEEEK